MRINDLFKNSSLKFVADFIGKVIYDGLGAEKNQISEGIVLLVSTLIIVFILYKLAWLVWNTMKFMLSCLEW